MVKATKHDNSPVLLKRILRELIEIKEKLNTSFNNEGDLWWCKVPKADVLEETETTRINNLIEIGKAKRKEDKK
tara:strand:- start:14 stop:235 length:222 start_codon:yes stop_codon:yes gene_type:complete